jgi:1-acyl-sn-glycerol-3-phosphate acyltransferase
MPVKSDIRHPTSETDPKFEFRNLAAIGSRDFGQDSDLELRASASSAPRARGLPRSTLPIIRQPLLRWFTWYSRRYLCRHFHSLRVSRSGRPPASALPLVVYSNHASWWDPLVWLVLKAEFFPGRKSFSPIDGAALQRYGMFRNFGFFGVEPGTRRGATQFLRSAEAILRDPGHLLALTPQGRFADARERPLRFQAGLGHLATRGQAAAYVPMAAEYVFWEERLPEILVRFGDPLEIQAPPAAAFDPEYWTGLFEQRLAATLDALAVEALRRDPDDFQVVLRGGAGQGGVYDWWRSLKAGLRGEAFTREHGRK